MPKKDKYLDLMRSTPVLETEQCPLKIEEESMEKEAAQIILGSFKGPFLQYSEPLSWAWVVANGAAGERLNSPALVEWARGIKQ